MSVWPGALRPNKLMQATALPRLDVAYRGTACVCGRAAPDRGR